MINNKIMKRKIKFLIPIFVILSMFFTTGCAAGNTLSQLANPQAPKTDFLNPEDLQVHFISVGQGDSELIKLPTGENVLIDAGDTKCGDYLVNYIKSQGVEEIDMAIATHPHSDHIGSMRDIIENFKVNHIMMPDFDYDTMTYTNLLYSIEENNVDRIVGKYGDTFEEGEAYFEVLGPVQQYEDANNISLVIMMTYGDNKFLFTGDQEKEAEKDVISMGYNLEADVLKVGHHGSKTSSSQEFLDAVKADIAVIEVGEGNDYGLPKDEVVMRIARSGATVYRTDQSGNIVVSSDGSNLSILTDDSLDSMLNSILEVPGNTSSDTDKLKFIGNKNTKIYHSTDCKSIPAEKNRIEFNSKEQAEKEGYKPHSNCVN